ncbi:hypothetical protein DPMN_015010, partial [Dreissena polymorpha]
MNPNMRQPGFPPQGHMPMNSHGMMMSHTNMISSQMPSQSFMGNPQVAGVRMPPMAAPPPYNQAVSQSAQNYVRPQVPGAVRAPSQVNHGRPKPPTEKEKYFLQQQAKLKQFGKSSGTRSSLDPAQLVDSVFGPSPSTKSATPRQQAPAPVNSSSLVSEDDGFGDFLGGTTSSIAIDLSVNLALGHLGSIVQSTTAVVGSAGVSHASSAPQTNTPASVGHTLSNNTTSPTNKTPPKDIKEMMLESCDLSAPARTQGFVKRTLKEIDPTVLPHTGPHVHHASSNARTWNDSEELTQLFSSEEIKQTHAAKKVVKGQTARQRRLSKPPAWLTDTHYQHPIYRQVLEACLVDGKVNTERLYPILMLSGLQKDVLGRLWSLCNMASPGQLTLLELTQLLAVIALTQKNYLVETVEVLNHIPQCPVPVLHPSGSQFTAATQSVPETSDVCQPGPQGTIAPQSGSSVGTSQINHVTGYGNNPSLIGSGSFYSSVPGLDTSLSSSVVFQLPAQPFAGLSTGIPSGFHSNMSGSSPATLSVTQLPSGGVNQKVSSLVNNDVDDDDDFADFQAAVPTVTSTARPATSSYVAVQTPASVLQAQKSQASASSGMLPSKNSPVTTDLTGPRSHGSTVESFFGSDDSSETASPDDDYFDGYRSADSKPSDSTFSTDQSDTDDFKNFDNYLDEFQQRKDVRDIDSPLHRPISRSTVKPAPPPASVTNVTPPKIAMVPLPVKVSLGKFQSGSQIIGASSPNVMPTEHKAAADNIDEFADYHSAPAIPSDLKLKQKSVSANDLIGDEDKYAALRSLEFAAEVPATTGSVLTETGGDNADDDWADFEASAQPSSVSKSGVLSLDNVDLLFQSSDIIVSGSSVPAILSIQNIAPSFVGVTDNEKDDDGDWADFQDFSAGGNMSAENPKAAVTAPNMGLVSVKNDSLKPDEILGLFKMKSDPPSAVKSRDDEFVPEIKVNSQKPTSAFKDHLHGIPKSNSTPNSFGMDTASILKEKYDENTCSPPPVDNFVDEEHDEYSRGFDFDDFVRPKTPEKKKVYGIYGVNPCFVVEGHKKSEELTKSKSADNVTSKSNEPSLHNDSDNDSDSVASKDLDMFKGKLGVIRSAEDSSSVASLDFVINKTIQHVKDEDAHSQSSSDFNSFDGGLEMHIPESKSMDSLDFKRDESDGQDSGSLNWDSAQKDQFNTRTEDTKRLHEIHTVDDEAALYSGVPVLGDRYSAIMASEHTASDKPCVEWGRCLESCLQMIQQANAVFHAISSPDVCAEVIQSQQGSQYIEGVIEIYRVVCKISHSMNKTGIISDTLLRALKEIDLAWNNLTAFLVGGSVM